MATVLLILAIGLVAGVLSGIFGIGGGVVMVPAMVLLLGYSQRTATGTSLGALVLPVAAVSVYEFHRAGHVEVRTSLLLGAGILVGSLVGAKIALGTGELLLRRLFAVLLVAMAARLAFAS